MLFFSDGPVELKTTLFVILPCCFLTLHPKSIFKVTDIFGDILSIPAGDAVSLLAFLGLSLLLCPSFPFSLSILL